MEKLRKLVTDGVPYESNEVKQAYEEFAEMERQWKVLECQYLELRNEFLKVRKDN